MVASLQNWSIQPTSMITKEIKSCGILMHFCANPLSDYFKEYHTQNLTDKIRLYLQSCDKESLKKSMPCKFMVAIHVNHEAENASLQIKEVTDINLLICVLAKSVSNMYVPNRELQIQDSIFSQDLYYLESEIQF